MAQLATLYRTSVASPLGELEVSADDDGITAIEFVRADDARRALPSALPSHLERCVRQLSEYFAGKRQSFDLPLVSRGTPFQQSVWRALLAIPYGERRTYSEIARAIGRRDAVRAVAMACGANPLPIVIPCHRVIAIDGLGGYQSGTRLKRWLLGHEGAVRLS